MNLIYKHQHRSSKNIMLKRNLIEILFNKIEKAKKPIVYIIYGEIYT